jgi:6-phosphogluconolactonase
MSTRQRCRLALLTTIAAASSVAMIAGQVTSRTGNVALYASVGEELITFTVDTARAALTRQASTKLPGFVQEAWASPSTPFLYVAWSNGGASYAGSGVAAAGDRHGVTAFRIDASGALHAEGIPGALRARPIYITGDGPGRHLLVAYNDPSGISVHAINRDGTVGAEVPQSRALDVGVYAHQVRVLPDNRGVILVTRGNQATGTTREDPGAVKVFRDDGSTLSNAASIAPGKGIEFRSRHLDFHPNGPWVFLTLESQNRLEVFRRNGDSIDAEPLFSKSTLAKGGGVMPGQTTSSVHVHPDGRVVYVANRGATAANANEIAVFRINQQTGEPSLIQNVDTHGFTPRTFAVDPSGRMLVVGNQTTVAGRGAGASGTVPANLATFRILADGRLEFVNRYDIAVGQKPLWWVGLARLP